MRKTMTLVFLVFANIILLAHAVIPHHHHQQLVCIEKTHCDGEKESHEHSLPERNHQHDGNDNPFSCILKQAIALPINPGKELSDCISSLSNFSLNYFITSVLTEDRFLINDNQASDLIPFLFAEYTYYISSNLGLRAPPAV